jgi:hypothetical protein
VFGQGKDRGWVPPVFAMNGNKIPLLTTTTKTMISKGKSEEIHSTEKTFQLRAITFMPPFVGHSYFLFFLCTQQAGCWARSSMVHGQSLARRWIQAARHGLLLSSDYSLFLDLGFDSLGAILVRGALSARCFIWGMRYCSRKTGAFRNIIKDQSRRAFETQ